ncbi:hypothetical protein Cni_G06919 [Canna indica]|uniref:RING-type domain-containing protein n=1 Tax=Canna indica TaxID=4628 RepID=A0AAQ3JXM6_9LILI|nr:hypothetical protein Cni_G06919 [Canna indica]
MRITSRGEERTGIDLSSAMLSDRGMGKTVNRRKRGREEAGALPVATDPNNGVFNSLFLQSNTSPTFVSLAELQSKSNSLLVSAGFQLASGDQQHYALNPLLPASSALFVELLPHVKQQQNEFDDYLRVQGELLQRSVSRKWRLEFQRFLTSTVSAAWHRIRAKEADVERAARQRAELEERLARLKTELLAWQAKAAVTQSTATILQAQLQRATEAAAAAREGVGESGGGPGPLGAVDDACSAACMDPTLASCRACRRRNAAVVVLPCRHFSLCAECAAAEWCPACGDVITELIYVAVS